LNENNTAGHFGGGRDLDSPIWLASFEQGHFSTWPRGRKPVSLGIRCRVPGCNLRMVLVGDETAVGSCRLNRVEALPD
jgi:hypothetical protein